MKDTARIKINACGKGNDRPVVAIGKQTGAAGKAKRQLKTLAGYDETFLVPIVYIYGTHRQYMTIKKDLFAEADTRTPIAKGLCSFGAASRCIGGGNICVVWVNSESIELKMAIPTFIHEITHVAQYILDMAGVKDSSGELMAKIEQREFERVFRWIFRTGGASNGPRKDFDRIRRLIDKFVAGACKVKNGKKAGERMRVIANYDDTFKSLIVHSYGTHSDFQRLVDLLFADPDESVPEEACFGYFGTGSRTVGGIEVFVDWINSKDVALKDSMPLFVNRLALLAKSLIENGNVNDKTGEVQAYIEGREGKRVLAGLLGMKDAAHDPGKVVNKIQKLMGMSEAARNNYGLAARRYG